MDAVEQHHCARSSSKPAASVSAGSFLRRHPFFDKNVLPVSSCLGMREDKLLHVFLTMLNDSFRSFIHVVTWLKERIVQRS